MAMATEKRLIDANDYPCSKCGKSYCYENCKGFKEWLNNTVDAVEVVHGRWIEKILVGGFAEEWGYTCSECGCTVSDNSGLSFMNSKWANKKQKANFCPHCGAKMDGDGNG